VTVEVTLAEFLLARIAEDEAAARAFARPNGTPGVGWIYGRDVDSDRQQDVDAFEGGPADPDSVLKECEAKRRIVERCIRLSKSPHARDQEVAQDFLTDLASAYADHPDYRDQAG
jgi:hypothetical protein